MKSIKIIALAVFGLLLGISSMEAQQNQNRGKNMNKAAVETMTSEQKQLIQEQRDRIKEKENCSEQVLPNPNWLFSTTMI